jgi:hypothetical protein
MKATKEDKKYLDMIEAAQIYFKQRAEDLQTNFDEKSERWQESEKGEETATAITSIEDVADTLETAYDTASNTFEIE